MEKKPEKKQEKLTANPSHFVKEFREKVRFFKNDTDSLEGYIFNNLLNFKGLIGLDQVIKKFLTNFQEYNFSGINDLMDRIVLIKFIRIHRRYIIEEYQEGTIKIRLTLCLTFNPDIFSEKADYIKSLTLKRVDEVHKDNYSSIIHYMHSAIETGRDFFIPLHQILDMIIEADYLTLAGKYEIVVTVRELLCYSPEYLDQLQNYIERNYNIFASELPLKENGLIDEEALIDKHILEFEYKKDHGFAGTSRQSRETLRPRILDQFNEIRTSIFIKIVKSDLSMPADLGNNNTLNIIESGILDLDKPLLRKLDFPIKDVPDELLIKTYFDKEKRKEIIERFTSSGVLLCSLIPGISYGNETPLDQITDWIREVGNKLVPRNKLSKYEIESIRTHFKDLKGSMPGEIIKALGTLFLLSSTLPDIIDRDTISVMFNYLIEHNMHKVVWDKKGMVSLSDVSEDRRHYLMQAIFENIGFTSAPFIMAKTKLKQLTAAIKKAAFKSLLEEDEKIATSIIHEVIFRCFSFRLEISELPSSSSPDVLTTLQNIEGHVSAVEMGKLLAAAGVTKEQKKLLREYFYLMPNKRDFRFLPDTGDRLFLLNDSIKSAVTSAWHNKHFVIDIPEGADGDVHSFKSEVYLLFGKLNLFTRDIVFGQKSDMFKAYLGIFFQNLAAQIKKTKNFGIQYLGTSITVARFEQTYDIKIGNKQNIRFDLKYNSADVELDAKLAKIEAISPEFRPIIREILRLFLRTGYGFKNEESFEKRIEEVNGIIKKHFNFLNKMRRFRSSTFIGRFFHYITNYFEASQFGSLTRGLYYLVTSGRKKGKSGSGSSLLDSYKRTLNPSSSGSRLSDDEKELHEQLLTESEGGNKLLVLKLNNLQYKKLFLENWVYYPPEGTPKKVTIYILASERDNLLQGRAIDIDSILLRKLVRKECVRIHVFSNKDPEETIYQVKVSRYEPD